MIPSPPGWLLQWSRVVAALGTLILTIYLATLYKRQQEQLAANHEAILETTDPRWNGDTVSVSISNFGNGVAKDLRLTTLVYVDTGAHREYTLRSSFMKRQDTQGEGTHIIQPGEEDIRFEGTSKIGEPAPISAPYDWAGTSFKRFVMKMKEDGAREVKYRHIIQGSELSKKRCFDRLDRMTVSFNPQRFDHQHSLENMPSGVEYGYDDIFQPFFREPTIDWDWIYYNGIRLLDRILPKVTIQLRNLDSSGVRRVKRVLLRRRIKYRTEVIINHIQRWFKKPTDDDTDDTAE